MSTVENRLPSSLWRALLFVAGWTFLGLFFGTRLMLSFAYAGRLDDWRIPVLLSLLEWYGWALLTPLAFWINRRLPLNSSRWYLAVLIHLPLSLVVSLLKIILDHQILVRVVGMSAAANTTDKIHGNIITYWAILGLVVGIDYYGKYKDREASLVKARLNALKMQLHPHFLFNTLNAAATLMHRDVEGAERMLARLAELLRASLESEDVNEIPLNKELEFLDRYLAIETVRFPDRLRVELDISEDTRDALVPSFVLQPLVENAVRHGIAAAAEPGWVRIRSEKRDGRLHLEVRNTGPVVQIPSLNAVRKRIGLANTEARLEQLYGNDYRFQLRSEGPIVVATIEIPFHA